MSAEPPVNNNAGSRPFRLQGKNFFVTWPQCNERKEAVLERAREFFGADLEFAVVSEEDHADGTPHLHAVFALTKRRDFKNANCFDSMANKHGNYQLAKQLRASVGYVVKKGVFIAHGVDVEAFLQAAKTNKSTQMARFMMEGSTLEQLNNQDPGFVLMHQRKIKEYQALITVWKDVPTKTWLPLQVTPLMMPLNLVRVACWLNHNMGKERVLRQKQLLLSSPPCMGKTSLIEQLRAYFRVYDSMGDKWFDSYDPINHELMVFDEFQATVPLSVMNKVLDGQKCTLQTKGGSVGKTRNIPVIILTNLVKEELYVGEKVNISVREAFLSRCLYVRLAKGEEAWRLLPFFADYEARQESDSEESEEEEESLPMLDADSFGYGAPLQALPFFDDQAAEDY